MNIIQANDCAIEAKIFGEYVAVLCAKRISIDTVTGTQEITNEVDGFFKSFDYKDLEYTVTLEAVHIMQDDVNPVAFDFLERQLQFIETDIRIIFRGQTGLKVFNGTVIVANGNSDLSPNELASSTLELKGTGPYTLEDVLPETVNLNLIMSGGTSTAFAKFRLINTDGEIIFQTDTLPEASGSNLSNPFNLTVPVLKGSYYYYWQVNSNMVNNQFYLDAPPTKTSVFHNGIVNEQSYPTQLYDFTEDRQVILTMGGDDPPPDCVAPGIPGSPTLPDGTVGIPWATSFALSGSYPFNLSNIAKPLWMTIALYTPSVPGTTYVTLQGTPDVDETDVGISFDINNACGTVNYSDMIDVAINPNQIPVNWDFTETSAPFGLFRLIVNSQVIVIASDTDSGSTNVNPGDTVEAQIIGSSTNDATLTVTDSVFGVIHSSSGPPTLSYSFVTVTAHTYDIAATITA